MADKGKAATIKEAVASAAIAPDFLGDDESAARGPMPDGDGDGNGYVMAELPNDAPVQPLGHRLQQYFFLDYRGQLIQLGTELRKGEIMSLFGTRMGYLSDVFPQYAKAQGGERARVNGFDQKRVQEALIIACSKRGIFDPTGKVRGRGAHRGLNSELYMHCGNQVLIAGETTLAGKPKPVRKVKPGLVGSYVFPTLAEISAPDEVAAPTEIGHMLVGLIASWRWQHSIFSMLYFCWIATAMVGGALKVRPHLWVNGPSGAGKTALQQLTRHLVSDWGIATEDATEAGLRQTLDQDTLAVMFDEMEPDETNSQVHLKIVKLARLAYSGSESLRGSMDHKAQSFQARSCFLFSSINHYQLPAQDRNRMAIVTLAPFPPNSTIPEQLLNAPLLKLWGNQLRRRIAEQWHRFDETLAEYQQEMLRQGYSGREQDTYGTLLACGDLLLHDCAPAQLPFDDEDSLRCKFLVQSLAGVLDRARSETEDTSERCIRHLTSHRLPAKAGEEQLSVGRWVSRALMHIINQHEPRFAAAKLRQHGLRLVQHVPDTGESAGSEPTTAAQDCAGIYLAVAGPTNKALEDIFGTSTWKGGIWMQALSSINGSVAARKARFDGPPHRCILIPIGECIDVQAAREEANQLGTLP